MKSGGMLSWICLGVILGPGAGLRAQEAAPAQTKAGDATFPNDPEARALYDKMIEAFRRPQTLSYKSDYRWSGQDGMQLGHCTYTAWLQKPNQFRVEGVSADGRRRATIVGDGQTLWHFWSGDRARFSVEDQETYNKTRSNVYMKKPAPPGGHSIGHETALLGVGMNMPVLDPSTFFGYTDSLQTYVDGVRKIEDEKVEDEQCAGIEVSIMKHQRSWYLWLSPKDHLPRKIKEVIRVAYDIVVNETWSQIVIDAPMPAKKFVWTPPEGWQQWQLPKPEDMLLKPGTQAPDFELPLIGGKLVKLSDFRGKIVWFYIWRAG